MSSHLHRLAQATFLIAVVSTTAHAEPPDFERANQYLRESSFSRACDAFMALEKAGAGALAREVTAKRLLACAQVGKASWSDLQKFGAEGEKDFARAWVMATLAERGYIAFDAAVPVLKQAATVDGRQGREARALLVRGALTQQQQAQYNWPRCAEVSQWVEQYATVPADIARGQYQRAVCQLNAPNQVKAGEAALAAVGSGTSEWADDALYLLGQRREGEQKYAEALGWYDQIVARFADSTSNVKSSARSQIENIRGERLSISSTPVELSGVAPTTQLNWRNVSSVRLTLLKADAFGDEKSPRRDAESLAQGASLVRSWTETLTVPVEHAPGSKSLNVEVPGPGVYVLQADAGQRHSNAMVLVTHTVTTVKSDGRQLLVWVTDAETGAARAKAEVHAWVEQSGAWQHLQGVTDGTGLVSLPVTAKNNSAPSGWVWSKSGADYSNSSASAWYGNRINAQELAYVLPDRPLYKPGENVGLKVFLRARAEGPSTPLANRQFTLTLRDPMSRAVAEVPLITNEFGTASYSLSLGAKPTLGQWSYTVTSPNTWYQQNNQAFRVEEYKPPEATVKVVPVGNPRPGETVQFKVVATYLSGGPIPNATGRALITVSRWSHRWGRWPDAGETEQDDSGNEDDFGDYRRRRYVEPNWPLANHTVVFKTGADGTALVEVPKSEIQGTPDLEFTAQVLVTDASRREISGTGQLRQSRRNWFVDVRSTHYIAKPGEKVTLQLRAEDPNGRPVSPEVLVRLSRTDDSGSLMKIAEARTLLKDGVGTVQLDADAIGQVVVQVFDGGGEGQAVLAQTDLWLTNDAKPFAPRNAYFQLYLDRTPLHVGDALRVLLVTPQAGGHALISVENEQIQKAFAIELVGRAKYVEIPLTGGMAPNAVLTVARVENGAFLQQAMPMRVTGSEVQLKVAVDLGAKVLEPGAPGTATVTATGAPAGTRSDTALSLVDEALFSIAPEQTDFVQFFASQQRAHTVRTMNSTQNIQYRARPAPVAEPNKQAKPADEEMREKDVGKVRALGAVADAPASALAAPAPVMAAEASSKKMEAKAAPRAGRASADGIDENEVEAPVAANGAPVKVRTNFSSSSGWYPSVLGTVGAPQRQSFTLADALTRWKAIATVVTAGPWLGRGSSSVESAKKLMVRLQAPRFFVENDEVTLSAVIESHLTSATDVTVDVTAPGFKALGQTSRVIRVAPNEVTRFDARFVVSELGDRKVKAVVRGGGTSDAMEWTLPAFVHGSAQRQFFSGRLKDTSRFEFDMPEKRKASQTRFELVASPSVLSVMLDALPYLAQYPYGCVEQTLSRFVPAVIARKTVKDFGLPAARVPADLDGMVEQGLGRLMGFQHGDGGWGWWQSDATNRWMTAYVVYALSLARDAGVAVDASAIERGRNYLLSQLGAARSEPETHVFMVYALSATGPVPAPVLKTVFDLRTRYSPRGRALVALALLNAKSPMARVAVENLDDIVKAAQSRADASVGDANDVWSTSAAIEATSLTLMAMTRHDPTSPLIQPLTDFLVLRRNGGRFRTTRDTAFATYALAELARREGARLQSGTLIVLVNGKEVKRLPYTRGGIDLQPLVLTDSAFVGGHNVVEIKRDGGGTGYFAATFDVFNQNNFIKGVGGDVTVKRTYTLLGKPSTTPGSAETEYGMPVESGTRVRVDVDIKANKAVEFVMLEDLKPAGFEAVMQRSGPEVCNYQCAHAELRTDRVAMFLQAIPVGVTHLTYELRAEVPGKFSALPARFEAMYAPEIQATADEMRFEVRDAPAGNARQ